MMMETLFVFLVVFLEGSSTTIKEGTSQIPIITNLDECPINRREPCNIPAPSHEENMQILIKVKKGDDPITVGFYTEGHTLANIIFNSDKAPSSKMYCPGTNNSMPLSYNLGKLTIFLNQTQITGKGNDGEIKYCDTRKAFNRMTGNQLQIGMQSDDADAHVQVVFVTVKAHAGHMPRANFFIIVVALCVIVWAFFFKDN